MASQGGGAELDLIRKNLKLFWFLPVFAAPDGATPSACYITAVCLHFARYCVARMARLAEYVLF
jgi:hypothetical protein